MKNKKPNVIVIAIVVYILLLLLLAVSENSSPVSDNSIAGGDFFKTLGNAIWYSIVTMTTVGYGDKTPDSLFGYIVGIFFMVASLGLLTFLVSWLISMFRGELLPSILLRLNRKRPWHVFFTEDKAADEIMRSWKQAYPDDLMIQAGPGKACEEADVSADFTPEKLLKKARGPVTFYCLGKNDAENFSTAAEITALGSRVYYRSELPMGQLEGMDCCSPSITCARQFWMKHPLQKDEKKLVLVGNGRHLSALLEQALLVNIFEPGQKLEYNVYGDTRAFREDHYALQLQGDSLNFGEGFPDAQTLYEADRIILCMDTDDANVELYSRLRKYHPFGGKLFIRLRGDLQKLPGVVIFGTDSELYTPDLIIHHTLDRTAMLINELYGRQNPAYAAAWETLDDYSRESNIAAADHLLTKLQILLDDRGITEVTEDSCRRAAEAYRVRKDADAEFFRRLEHMRWCRFLFLRNWRYENIPSKNKKTRVHPLLCPYAELSPVEQAKDDNAWIAIGQIFEDGQTNA